MMKGCRFPEGDGVVGLAIAVIIGGSSRPGGSLSRTSYAAHPPSRSEAGGGGGRGRAQSARGDL